MRTSVVCVYGSVLLKQPIFTVLASTSSVSLLEVTDPQLLTTAKALPQKPIRE